MMVLQTSQPSTQPFSEPEALARVIDKVQTYYTQQFSLLIGVLGLLVAVGLIFFYFERRKIGKEADRIKSEVRTEISEREAEMESRISEKMDQLYSSAAAFPTALEAFRAWQDGKHFDAAEYGISAVDAWIDADDQDQVEILLRFLTNHVFPKLHQDNVRKSVAQALPLMRCGGD